MSQDDRQKKGSHIVNGLSDKLLDQNHHANGGATGLGAFGAPMPLNEDEKPPDESPVTPQAVTLKHVNEDKPANQVMAPVVKPSPVPDPSVPAQGPFFASIIAYAGHYDERYVSAEDRTRLERSAADGNGEISSDLRARIAARSDQERIILLDYKQLQMSVLALYSTERGLIDSLAKQEDVHARVASLLFDVPLESVSHQMRTNAKHVNLNVFHRESSFILGQKLAVSSREAFALLDKYSQLFPGLTVSINKMIEEARRQSFVETLLGRRCYFKHLSNADEFLRKTEERDATAAVLFGSYLDLILQTKGKIQRLLEASTNTNLILQLGNEFVFAVPVDAVEKTVRDISAAMKFDLQLQVPNHIYRGVGNNWLAAKENLASVDSN